MSGCETSMKGVERKRGNSIGFWFFRVATRLTGLSGAYGLLYIVCLYYLLVDHALVAESLPYIRRRFPETGWFGRYRQLYLLFVAQGKTLVDRYAIASGYDKFSLELRGYERTRELIASSPKGAILLTAHIGSWQVAMSALQRFDRRVHVMMRPEDNETVRESLELNNESERVRVILTSEALGGVIEAMKAIDAGDLVTIMGDRPYDFPAMEATFLGGTVRFPYGAFTLAAAAKCPIIVLLSARLGTGSYVVDVSHVIPHSEGKRVRDGNSLGLSVQRYADILDQYVQEHPYQWFVFRDIWKLETHAEG